MRLRFLAAPPREFLSPRVQESSRHGRGRDTSLERYSESDSAFKREGALPRFPHQQRSTVQPLSDDRSPMMVFDFDGVLIDSLREAALTTYNCVSGCFVTNLADTPQGYFDLFSRNRHLIQPAGDFLPFGEWCLKYAECDPTRSLSRSELRTLLSHATLPLPARTTQFFAARLRLFEHAPDEWFELHEPFEPLWSFLRAAGYSPLLIVTNKNRKAVADLCKYFTLPVEGKDIYSGDTGKRKTAQMLELAQRFPDCPFAFIDDSVNNLLELQSDLANALSLRYFHACWGYVGADDPERAAAHGIPSLSQAELIARLEAELHNGLPD